MAIVKRKQPEMILLDYNDVQYLIGFVSNMYYSYCSIIIVVLVV